jgi:hypothetical protein
MKGRVLLLATPGLACGPWLQAGAPPVAVRGTVTAQRVETNADVVVALEAPGLVLAGLVGVKDPMDRLVVAAARATRSPVISVDDALDGFGVERVWD